LVAKEVGYRYLSIYNMEILIKCVKYNSKFRKKSLRNKEYKVKKEVLQFRCSIYEEEALKNKAKKEAVSISRYIVG